MANVHHPNEAPFNPRSPGSEEPESVLRPRSPSGRARERNRPLTVVVAIGIALIAAVVVAFALGDDGDRRMEGPAGDDPAAPVHPGQPAR